MVNDATRDAIVCYFLQVSHYLLNISGNEQSFFYVVEKEFLVERIFVMLIAIVSRNNRKLKS